MPAPSMATYFSRNFDKMRKCLHCRRPDLVPRGAPLTRDKFRAEVVHRFLPLVFLLVRARQFGGLFFHGAV